MDEHLKSEDTLPPAPSFTEEDYLQCERSGDYRPLFFEWYKFVGCLGTVVAHIQQRSPCFRDIPSQHYYVLIGLLNRCARLMLSNIALSHEGRFGETTIIVDRCIFESAAKIIWLCSDPTPEKFNRYLADGLKKDLEFKQHIEENISERSGNVLPIEKRMLNSISNTVGASGLSEEEIATAKRLPDLGSILSAIGASRLTYVIMQKIGSHHVHGTWTSLLFHYLEEGSGDEGKFVPRGHDCQTHINQFMVISTLVLEAFAQYLRYAINPPECDTFISLLDTTKEEISQLYERALGGDLTT